MSNVNFLSGYLNKPVSNIAPTTFNDNVMKKILFIALASIALLLAALTGFVYQNTPVKAIPGDTNSLVLDPPPSQTPNAIADTIGPKNASTLEQAAERTLDYPPIGKVTLYGNMSRPTSLVLFLSGDGGWNLGVIDMARALAQDGQTLVVGIDIIKYYKKLQASSGKCLYPSSDLEDLSEFVQRELALPDYHKPVLVGYSSGATLTYALLCQAPVGTFRGGVALGFCPDIQLNKPLCEGSGKLTMVRRKDGLGFDFTDQPAPGAPLEVLHGEMDQACNCQETCDFFEKVKNVTVARLPKVGHGYGVPKNWLPQFKQAFGSILSATDRSTGMLLSAADSHLPVAMAAAGDTGMGDLPLSITQATADASTPMIVFISGDGGWTGFDQQICDQLAARHVPTVGLNSQTYFWKKKTPEQTVSDLAPVIRQYLQTWGKSKFLLVGYSFGANVAPFIYTRLSADLQQKAQNIVLLSPDVKGDFEIHVAGMLGKGGGPYDVAAEVRGLQNTPVLCVSGVEEGNEMQTALKGAAHVRFEKIPGSHHYNNDAAKVAATIFPIQ